MCIWEVTGVSVFSLPLTSQLLPFARLVLLVVGPLTVVLSQSLLCDLTKGTQATDGRLLRWLPRGELGSAGEDVGSDSRFSPHACGWAFWDSSLAVMADRLEWGGGVQRGPFCTLAGPGIRVSHPDWPASASLGGL